MSVANAYDILERHIKSIEHCIQLHEDDLLELKTELNRLKDELECLCRECGAIKVMYSEECSWCKVKVE